MDLELVSFSIMYFVAGFVSAPLLLVLGGTLTCKRCPLAMKLASFLAIPIFWTGITIIFLTVSTVYTFSFFLGFGVFFVLAEEGDE